MCSATLVIDNFLPDPVAHRKLALSLPFYSIRAPDNGIYRCIHVRPTDELKPQIEKAIGRKAEIDYTFFRYATYGLPLNHLVHADSGLSPFGCVLYLNEADQIVPGSGTAFYRHKKLGYEKMPTEEEVRKAGKSPKRVWDTLEASWNEPDAWEQISMVPMIFNRAIVFDTTRFHSRLPLDAFGNTLEDARLIQVSFFQA